MPELAHRVKSVSASETLAIAARAKALKKQGVDVISLAAGEPDWDMPYEAKEAALTAVREGNTRYTAASGLPELKEAVAEKLTAENKIETVASNVIITTGAKYALFSVIQALVNPDDEVILIAPYWVSYIEMVKMAGGVPKIIHTSEDDGFKLDIDELEGFITSRVKGIILNYPSNPSGVTYTAEELRRIGEIAVKKDIFIISDEIYEYFSYDQPHTSIASLSKKIADQTITINGFSKSYAIPGWRVGYATGPADIINAMNNIQSHSTSNPNTIAQISMLTALKESRKWVDKMITEFKERREFMVDALNSLHGFRCIKPEGAFYVFPNIQYYLGNEVGGEVPTDTVAFSNILMDKAHVSVVPGSSFGLQGHVRISYCESIPRLKEAIARIDSILEK
ncbi:MAG: pyridoxal phosphate-dependent aminotransferase [Brevinematales bacterium]|nr:pyridoxal phosphate-dependent aminotransferase [Brevinematales bacterium]